MFTKIRHSRSGFTLVELVIGMTIFSLSITAIFLLLDSTMKSVKYSRSEIIVSNLLREQIELVRNIRDSNIAKGAAWDAVRIDNTTNKFANGIYTIENNFENTNTEFEGSEIKKSPVKISSVIIDESKKNIFDDNAILKEKFDATKLCLNDKKLYVHCTGGSNETETAYASYFSLEAMNYNEKTIKDGENNQWYIIDARVIVRDGSNYREYDAKSAITDWQK